MKKVSQSTVDDANLYLTNRIMECNNGELFAFAVGRILPEGKQLCLVKTKELDDDELIADLCIDVLLEKRPEVLDPEYVKVEQAAIEAEGKSAPPQTDDERIQENMAILNQRFAVSACEEFKGRIIAFSVAIDPFGPNGPAVAGNVGITEKAIAQICLDLLSHFDPKKLRPECVQTNISLAEKYIKDA